MVQGLAATRKHVSLTPTDHEAPEMDAFRESDTAGGSRGRPSRKTSNRCLEKLLPSISGKKTLAEDLSSSFYHVTRDRTASLEEKNVKIMNEPKSRAISIVSPVHDKAAPSLALSSDFEGEPETIAKDEQNSNDSHEGENCQSVYSRLTSKQKGAKENIPIRLRRLKLNQKLQEWKDEETNRGREAMDRAKSKTELRVPRNEGTCCRKLSLPLMSDFSRGSDLNISPRVRKISDIQHRCVREASPTRGRHLWASAVSPKNNRRVIISPNTNRGASVSPNTNRGASVSPNTNRGASVSPNTNRGASVSPNTNRGASVSPNTNRGASVSPNTNRGASVSPNTNRGASVSPNTNQGASVSPKNRGASVSPNNNPVGESVSPDNNQGTGDSPTANRGASVSPNNNRDQSRASSEKERRLSIPSDPALKLRVQDFLSKQQPKAAVATLRTEKPKVQTPRSGVSAISTASVPRRSRERVVVNTDTSPSLYEFQDRSWYYQDKSGKCRYLRVPESPPPPISWVFERDDT